MFEQIVSAMADYTVTLEPDQNTPEWWAGARSVCHLSEGEWYLACRMREGNSPRGVRGYEVRILKSDDGVDFRPINHLRREEAKLSGFERPSLVQDPATRKFRLYGCSGTEGGWIIWKLDDVDDPADFDVRTYRRVLGAENPADGFAHVVGYKDPVVFWDGARWHLFVIGHDRVERIWHFASEDGISWQAASEGPAMENAGWHNFYTRPASVLPLAVGYLFVYEGSHVNWRDPVYNIATGLAYSPDLLQFVDLTPGAPLLRSTTPGDYHTWRYSHWLRVDDMIYAYAEVARPNNTNEIRLGAFRASDALL